MAPNVFVSVLVGGDNVHLQQYSIKKKYLSSVPVHHSLLSLGFGREHKADKTWRGPKWAFILVMG
jgi:hypothetical protein